MDRVPRFIMKSLSKDLSRANFYRVQKNSITSDIVFTNANPNQKHKSKSNSKSKYADKPVFTITVSENPHLFIQHPTWPCHEERVNSVIKDLELRYPNLCFDITSTNTKK